MVLNMNKKMKLALMIGIPVIILITALTVFLTTRDSDEKFQYDLYKLAAQKGYYMAAPASNQQDSSQVKTFLSQSSSVSMN